ncbi:MAG TPA: biotin--[acetyl-CoA-carboxylase] ligase [Candidatus Binataceae bacterium]|nr:biotin--[acetyl-CoA-carboxylase] ligase [Candidatus Binataceae bacterium]
MPSNPYQAIQKGEPGSIGWRIDYFQEAGSTQRVAAELAEQGAAQGTVVIAEQQTAGRGRMGRQWHSPSGVNLYATIILRPTCPVAEVPRLSLVAGVAAAEALEMAAPGIVALKWPNDVWLNGLKAGGIIAEAVTDASRGLQCVLLGIGLNLNLAARDIPPELRGKATSVLIATGYQCDRAAIASALLQKLDTRYMETERHGFATIRPLWERYSALTGRPVTVVDGGSRIMGMVTGIDADGALLLETAEGPTRILTGDVSIEGAYG